MYEGGCLCGQVRFRIEGEPIAAARCFCMTCQKLSGGGHTENMTFAESDMQVTGAFASYTWTADSGGRVTTCFCPQCGAPLFGTGNHAPQYRFVRVAAFDDPAVYRPQLMVFAKRRQAWDQDGEDIPTFETTPSPDEWSPKGAD